MKKLIPDFAVVATLGCVLVLVIQPGRPRAATAPPALQQATFAAGCFWGVEAAFRKTRGVTATLVGYTGGHTDHPTYRQISMGGTGHAEAVRVTYDPARVSYAELLDVFWGCHDPTIDQGDGPHASIIFVHDAEQASVARASLDEVARSNAFKHPIVTRILTAGPFYPAEDYHQHYLEAHGATGSCHVGPVVIHTRLASDAAAARRSGSVDPAMHP